MELETFENELRNIAENLSDPVSITQALQRVREGFTENAATIAALTAQTAELTEYNDRLRQYNMEAFLKTTKKAEPTTTQTTTETDPDELIDTIATELGGMF